MDNIFKQRKCWKVMVLIIFGICVHGLILKAALDIYFSSPIDNGMSPIKSTHKPPAKRLVFIVADGLRAQAIFGTERAANATHLIEITKTRGSWGVAHTRVPTESRPGHVALLGGVYEDPAAILKGWKANPVDFDSVINQSTNAWCWGGPSIVNMFNKDNLPHIHLHSYHPSKEDFGKNDTISLDQWVFDQVNIFIEQQKACKDCTKFRDSGNLFFLHLLGTDTAGHAYKPGSSEYNNNIKFVDEHIPEIESLFENAFPDKSTAYVFTADHGMTDWGSHGAGSDQETKTPIIAWGAGIKRDRKQKDIKQIDVAPLLSALIGVNYPINSLGKLPVEYIDASTEILSEMLISNVRQLMEIFNIKRFRRMRNSYRFVPFKGLKTKDLKAKLDYLNMLAELKMFELLKLESNGFMDILIKGADYYHNYYQLPILISITIGIIAWIIYLATFNIRVNRVIQSKKHFFLIHVFLFGAMYSTTVILLKVQLLPLMYYFYFIFPIFMLQILAVRFYYIIEAMKIIKYYGFRRTLSLGTAYLTGLWLLVRVFRNRQALSLVMWFMAGLVWVSPSLNATVKTKQKVIWAVCCCYLSVFPFLPVMKTTFNLGCYMLGYIFWWIFIRLIIDKQLNNPNYDATKIRIISLQLTMFKLTPIYTLAVAYGYVAPDSILKYVAWTWAFYPMFLIPRSSTHIFVRTTSVFIGFATFYIMVSLNYEPLFLIMYAFVLCAWLMIESQCYDKKTVLQITYDRSTIESERQTSEDYRRAFFFIALIFMGFFGTGNIASMSSFDPMWVRCFLTVFSPFRMTALILVRIMVPFIYTSCVCRAVNILRRTNTFNMFCIVLMFSDLMLLVLLYHITNIGSWLEIGTSLSQFIIMEAFVVILLVLYGFANLLTTASYTVNLTGLMP